MAASQDLDGEARSHGDVTQVGRGGAVVLSQKAGEEAPVPLIVSKGRGQAGDEMVAEARRLGIPVVEDASLVDLLISQAIGNRIPPDAYTDVARLLIRFGI